MIDWQEVDQITSKFTALSSLMAFGYLFFKLSFGSSVSTLKVMSGLFLFGWISNFAKMYLVPRARQNSEFDSLTFFSILLCTLSASANVASWFFASTYFDAG